MCCHPSLLRDIRPSPQQHPLETLLSSAGAETALGSELWREEVGQCKAGQETRVASSPAILAPKI